MLKVLLLGSFVFMLFLGLILTWAGLWRVRGQR